MTGTPVLKSVSIVIPNHDGKEVLRRCMPQVLQCSETTSALDEIIVVDDGSEDGSPDVLAANFPAVRVIPRQGHRGAAVAANAGFREARNPYVLLLSNDMVPDEGCVDRLLPHLRNEGVFAVTPRQVNAQGETLIGANSISIKWGVPKPQWNFHPRPEEEPSQPVAHCGGGASLFNRQYFLDLGGFDTDLFVPFFYEDDDLFYRAWKRGYSILYEPRARVYHFHDHPTAVARRYRKRWCKQLARRNGFLYVWKNVHDPRMMAAHIARTLLQTAVVWLKGDLGHYAALAAALRLLPTVRIKRREERRMAKRTDREAVEAILSGSVPAVKGIGGDDRARKMGEGAALASK